MDIRYLSEYVSWIIRNAYKESGLSGSEVSCDSFSLILNTNAFDSSCLPDSLLGFEVLQAPLNSDIEVALGVKPEDTSSKDVRKFLRTFHEVHSWSDFHYGVTWKEECGIDVGEG